ncbi:NucA/NucB deoxyribonuclease domain-containing protein [Streptomyces sp. NBC_01167]|uniref:NucA/NucB deoxyribonuclease domain-containing protein n=1 Tax=Streptomyces sp. NBC_01167 TaxID=2903756 RepID=UPI00386B57F0|nr:NucA/NucB deoxyribonuclease domain-containing protein [Streptomyces sp. NBC_01167]
MQIIDAEHPLPEIGSTIPTAEVHRRSRGNTNPPAPAQLTEHGEQVGLRTGATYESSPEDVPPPGEKTRKVWDDISDCWQELGGQPGEKVINHFRFCSMRKMGYNTIDQNGKVVGRVNFTQTTFGVAPTDDRAAYFTTSLDNFALTGAVTDGFLAVGVGASGYTGSDGSNKPCEVDDNAINPTKLSEWKDTSRTALHWVTQNKADGYGRDHLSRCGVATSVKNSTGNWVTVMQTGIRIDSASYLSGPVGQAVFDRVVPVMTYSRTNPNNGDVGKHIYTAQTNPGATDPKVPGKAIPGSIASKKTLSRLYEEWDAAAKAQRAKNESAKNTACAPIRPTPSTGLDCDEYPFGSTWEGAGRGDKNFSVKYLNASQNRSAGALLGNWYSNDRILHRDRFYVTIL